jgi:hypothetical protein
MISNINSLGDLSRTHIGNVGDLLTRARIDRCNQGTSCGGEMFTTSKTLYRAGAKELIHLGQQFEFGDCTHFSTPSEKQNDKKKGVSKNGQTL